MATLSWKFATNSLEKKACWRASGCWRYSNDIQTMQQNIIFDFASIVCTRNNKLHFSSPLQHIDKVIGNWDPSTYLYWKHIWAQRLFLNDLFFNIFHSYELRKLDGDQMNSWMAIFRENDNDSLRLLELFCQKKVICQAVI